ncbi:hypothetical protein GU926_08175 [Nibribacter ruber]|uniref:DUF2158 domain-containing protein n=1 Tax=Nibribacter ruber TaxID=2698458 RepID=A0A6P1P1K8_9BACT|nr:hypothetical protein [Nibribacter ruber]QHL87412.1 hypothetical protein GU926_08175 [Nibribacter ruber]
MEEYREGQLVALVSNPECRMTVAAKAEDGKYVCVWINHNKDLRSCNFPGAMLQLAEEKNRIGFSQNDKAS